MNKKIEIYIDFEAIDRRHALIYDELKTSKFHSIPFAYTIGKYPNNDKNQEMQIKTNVINFRNYDKKEYFRKFRIKLLADIAKLNGIKVKDLTVNNINEKFVFYGWNPVLENTIIKTVLGNQTICHNANIFKDKFTSKQEISLKWMSKGYEDKSYFKNTIEILKKKSIRKITDESDPGLIASLAGFALFEAQYKKKNKNFLNNAEITTILNELRIYNSDDIRRIDFIYKNSKTLNHRIKAKNVITTELKLVDKKRMQTLNKINLFRQIDNIVILDKISKSIANEDLLEILKKNLRWLEKAIELVNEAEFNGENIKKYLERLSDDYENLSKKTQNLRDKIKNI